MTAYAVNTRAMLDFFENQLREGEAKLRDALAVLALHGPGEIRSQCRCLRRNPCAVVEKYEPEVTTWRHWVELCKTRVELHRAQAEGERAAVVDGDETAGDRAILGVTLPMPTVTQTADVRPIRSAPRGWFGWRLRKRNP